MVKDTDHHVAVDIETLTVADERNLTIKVNVQEDEKPKIVARPLVNIGYKALEEELSTAVASKNKAIEVYSVNHKRTFCYVKDAVRMLWLLAESKQTIGETYNIGNEDEEITMGDLAYKIIDLVGKDLQINPQPATIGSPERRCPNMGKLVQVISYNKKYPLKDGLKKTFDWYKTKIFSGKEVSAV